MPIVVTIESHRAEIIEIRGNSYRVKESKARSTRKRKARRKR